MVSVDELAPRTLPHPMATTSCNGCGNTIVWALTVAGPNGRGGKAMPLDPVEDLGGNVAVTAPSRGRLLARVLTKDETIDRPVEYAAMPHFATCFARAHPELPPDVIDLQERRRTTRRRRR